MVEPAKKSDLGTRTLSAIVMVAVAGVALWLGGWVFIAFVVAVGLGVIWEWWGLARLIAKTPLGAALWLAVGVSYIGAAMFVLLGLRQTSLAEALAPIALVIAVDVGAYFAGRTFGGPKIAPAISPSKTWAGLIGGVIGACLVHLAYDYANPNSTLPDVPAQYWMLLLATSLAVAITAQVGDFFESWMKRRAGVKDSSNIIPGHGGLFDRVDGLLAVLFVSGLAVMVMS
jgi:phosphatidate cytidylyltransferase